MQSIIRTSMQHCSIAFKSADLVGVNGQEAVKNGYSRAPAASQSQHDLCVVSNNNNSTHHHQPHRKSIAILSSLRSYMLVLVGVPLYTCQITWIRHD
jgi:hypothetical protein